MEELVSAHTLCLYCLTLNVLLSWTFYNSISLVHNGQDA